MGDFSSSLGVEDEEGDGDDDDDNHDERRPAHKYVEVERIMVYAVAFAV